MAGEITVRHRSLPPRGPSTVDDFLAIPQSRRFHELIGGQLVQRALPVWRHQRVASQLNRLLGVYDKPAAKGRRGGWYIQPDVEIRFSARDVYRPDLAGWLREQVPADLDVDSLCSLCPNWVCEIISPGHRREDTILKRTRYAQYGVQHYWIIDPQRRQLTVLGLHGTHYQELASFSNDEVASAEPFLGLTVKLAQLFAAKN